MPVISRLWELSTLAATAWLSGVADTNGRQESRGRFARLRPDDKLHVVELNPMHLAGNRQHEISKQFAGIDIVGLPGTSRVHDERKTLAGTHYTLDSSDSHDIWHFGYEKSAVKRIKGINRSAGCSLMTRRNSFPTFAAVDVITPKGDKYKK